MAYTHVNPYITVTELAEELKAPVPTAGSAVEDKFKRAIDNASRWVDEWTGQTYYLRDYSIIPLVLDQHSDGVYNDQIFVPYKPIISLTQIESAGVALVEGTDYSFDPKGRIYSMIGDWHPIRPDGLVRIFGTFGYAQASPAVPPTGLPGKIIIATRLVAAVFSGDYKKEFMGIDGSVENMVASEIPKTVYQVLGKRMPILN